MIDIVNLWHHYGVAPTLRGVNLRVEPGEILCVMGPNGMGKSTLLSVVAGILPPIKGHVAIDGLVRRSSIDAEKAIRKKVVYLPDVPWTPANRTGREFLFAMGRLYEVDEDRLFDHVTRLLGLFDLIEQADSAIGDYSTGQRKKIGICGALVTEAPIMILDEPFSGGLDSSALHALQKVLHHLGKETSTTIMMAVPVPELVEDLADRIAIIKAGRILACDSPNGLRLASGAATFAEAIDRLINPAAAAKLNDYFQRDSR